MGDYFSYEPEESESAEPDEIDCDGPEESSKENEENTSEDQEEEFDEAVEPPPKITRKQRPRSNSVETGDCSAKRIRTGLVALADFDDPDGFEELKMNAALAALAIIPDESKAEADHKT